MIVRPARSQAPTPAPDGGAAAPADPEPPTDDDDGSDPGAPALVAAPADPAARRAWLTAQLDGAVAGLPRLAPATIGAAVIDLTTGETLWSHGADRPLSIASAQKIVTAATALATLGPGFRWRTTVYGERFDPTTGLVAGDLVVRGRGDPTLWRDDLTALARDLRWRGVERVDGDLVIDASYFDGVDEPPRFADQPKERAGFRASIAATSLARNAVTVVVVADRKGLGLAAVSLDPPLTDSVRLVEDDVVTVASGRTRIGVATEVKRDRIELRVRGQIAAGDAVTFVRRRVEDPTAMFAEVLRAELAAAGIRVRGKIVRTPPAPGTPLEVLAERASPPLADVLRDLAKTSDNYLAETVLKTIGAEVRAVRAGRPATWDDGLAEVRAFAAAAGIDPATFRIDNGSGLFDASAVSADALTKILAAAWRDFRVGPELAAALAIGGVDGTLRRRFTDPSLRGRVRAKTGTLAAASSLAGYVGADTRRPLAFAVLVNQLPSGTRPDAKRLQDAIAAAALAYATGP